MNRSDVLAANIQGARLRAGWSVGTLWISYCSLGGTRTLEDLGRFLAGEAALTDDEYDILAQALNDEFVARGVTHPVPYADEVEEGPSSEG